MSHSATMSLPQTARDEAAPVARPRRATVRAPRTSAMRRRATRSRLGAALVRLHRKAAAVAFMDPVETPSPSVSHAPDAVRFPAPQAASMPSTHPGPAPRPNADAEHHAGAAVRERRAFPRRESICLVSVYRNENDAPVNQQEVRWLLHSSPLKGAIDDISMNGVAFLLPEPMESGGKLLMRLINRRLDRHVDTSGRVVRSTPDGLGEWKIVCRFDRNLSLDQVHEYGQNLFVTGLV